MQKSKKDEDMTDAELTKLEKYAENQRNTNVTGGQSDDEEEEG